MEIKSFRIRKNNYGNCNNLINENNFLNKKNALQILIDCTNFLEKKNISYFVMFGTLLGAVRDEDFIEYDNDIDLIVLDANIEKVKLCLDDFSKINLHPIRVQSDLISLFRNGDYIDINFFKTNYHKNVICSDSYIFPYDFFISTSKVTIRGNEFSSPIRPKELLLQIYGKDWRTPKRNATAKYNTFSGRIKNLLKKILSERTRQFIRVIFPRR